MKFPKILYVKIEEGGNANEDYMVPAATKEELAEIGGAVPVGVYKLVETTTIHTVVSLA